MGTPCRWLMEKVEQSILRSGMVEARVIPNAVDTSVFHPADQQVARNSLAIPQEATVLLFTANGIRRNIWKDYRTMQAAIALVADHLKEKDVLFIALGEDAPTERIGRAEIRFVPYQGEPEAVARYYQAVDVYIHAARADTFPNTVLEALACGTPVVATAVGGISEQVRPLRIEGSKDQAGGGAPRSYGPGKATGVLVPMGDAEAMAHSIVTLLTNQDCLRRLGENAAADARQRFDLERQADAYLEWYREIIERWQVERSGSQRGAVERGARALSSSD